MYKNGQNSEYSLDPPLTNEGKIKAKEKFEHLLEGFGVPDKIITSPYLRARETAEIARNVIQDKTGMNVKILYKRELGEYLGHQKIAYSETELRPETLKYKPIPPENIGQYKKRVKNYNSKIQRFKNSWYITHGMFIKFIAKINNIDVKYPSSLGGIFIAAESYEEF